MVAINSGDSWPCVSSVMCETNDYQLRNYIIILLFYICCIITIVSLNSDNFYSSLLLPLHIYLLPDIDKVPEK